MIQARESRPRLTTGAAPKSVATHPQHTAITRSEAIERLTDAYAVLVVGAVARRQIYLNLPAAQRAVERASARGATAHLVLVRLVPIDAHALEGGDPR